MQKLSNIIINEGEYAVDILVYANDETYKRVLITKKHVMKKYKYMANVEEVLNRYSGRAISSVSIEDYTPTPNYPNGGMCVKLNLCESVKMNNKGVVASFPKESITLYECKFLASAPKSHTLVV